MYAWNSSFSFSPHACISRKYQYRFMSYKSKFYIRKWYDLHVCTLITQVFEWILSEKSIRSKKYTEHGDSFHSSHLLCSGKLLLKSFTQAHYVAMIHWIHFLPQLYHFISGNRVVLLWKRYAMPIVNCIERLLFKAFILRLFFSFFHDISVFAYHPSFSSNYIAIFCLLNLSSFCDAFCSTLQHSHEWLVVFAISLHS